MYKSQQQNSTISLNTSSNYNKSICPAVNYENMPDSITTNMVNVVAFSIMTLLADNMLAASSL